MNLNFGSLIVAKSLSMSKSVSLYKIKDMAKITEPFKIGDFHMGFQGGSFIVWKEDFLKVLDTKDFDKAKTAAYYEIKSYCAEKKIAPPPFPK